MSITVDVNTVNVDTMAWALMLVLTPSTLSTASIDLSMLRTRITLSIQYGLRKDFVGMDTWWKRQEDNCMHHALYLGVTLRDPIVIASISQDSLLQITTSADDANGLLGMWSCETSKMILARLTLGLSYLFWNSTASADLCYGDWWREVTVLQNGWTRNKVLYTPQYTPLFEPECPTRWSRTPRVGRVAACRGAQCSCFPCIYPIWFRFWFGTERSA